MKCPFCGFLDSKVIETRTVEETNSIRRRRECLECQQRFTTYEKLESIPLVVIKKDKTRETFDREKVLAGIITACEKRQVPTAKMEAMVDEIEQQLLNSLEREIPSSAIGELVMEKLKEVDEVAYVRFASVYRQFKDINTFMEELKKLLS
ncbi:MAG: transcriptional repressor NrdR [Ruminococcaceae bacterium]|nr:transcriptional repressor NrdR [Oscillospiraceae bacterium]